MRAYGPVIKSMGVIKQQRGVAGSLLRVSTLPSRRIAALESIMVLQLENM